jgi:hypothetical protein
VQPSVPLAAAGEDAEARRTRAEAARQDAERRRGAAEAERAAAELVRLEAEQRRAAADRARDQAATEVRTTAETLTALIEQMRVVEEMRRAYRGSSNQRDRDAVRRRQS